MAVPAGDIAAARGVWSKIFASPEDNGGAVLARMFSDHPETKSYFSHFGGLDEGSAQVRAHGKVVLTALNDMIQHLDSADGFNGVVTPLAKKHATQLKVDPKNFRVICDVILAIIDEKFGGEGRGGMEKVASALCGQINSVYKESGW
ncbi:cytoglobin-1-like [Polypterus senegalus]